jgi:hypothetical protein
MRRTCILQSHNRLDTLKAPTDQKALTAAFHQHQLSLTAKRQCLDQSK